MKTHSLTIVASGLNADNDAYADRLYEAGCDDATVAVQKGLLLIEFERAAPSFKEAVLTAIDDVRKAGATVERVEPDHLVGASEIAERTEMSRAAVSLYVSGKRGKERKPFPAPVARVTTNNPLWDWAEVAGWMVEEKGFPQEIAEEAVIIRDINKAILHARASPGERQFEKRLSVA